MELREPKIPQVPIRRIQDMGLKELERIRLILRGGSVIEWRRLHFRTREEVDRFLRIQLINPEDPVDEAWARQVLADAVEYLRTTFNYRVADRVASPKEIHDLFLFASGAKEPKRLRRIACVVLKVMHVIQHLEGRDLAHQLALSEKDFTRLLTDKVRHVAEEMLERGLPLISFEDSVKSRDSMITKLLAKRETLAAQVYDRTRFRIVTQRREDILPVLYFLTQRLFPFNFVIPKQTENSLISFKDLVKSNPHLARYQSELHLDLDYELREAREMNRFSGSSYRVLNYVVDMPLRMDAYLPPPEKDNRERKSRVAFGLVEFQLVDEATRVENERGENSHERYKARQKEQVLRRLSRGLVVPRIR